MVPHIGLESPTLAVDCSHNLTVNKHRATGCRKGAQDIVELLRPTTIDRELSRNPYNMIRILRRGARKQALHQLRWCVGMSAAVRFLDEESRPQGLSDCTMCSCDENFSRLKPEILNAQTKCPQPCNVHMTESSNVTGGKAQERGLDDFFAQGLEISKSTSLAYLGCSCVTCVS